MADDGYISIRVIPNTKKFRADLQRMLDRTEKTMQLVLDVDLSKAERTLDRFKERINQLDVTLDVDADTRRAEGKLDRIANDRTATVNADADTGKATLKLAALTRRRTVEIAAQLTAASMAKVSTQLAALSGARLAGDYAQKLSNTLQNLDRSLPKLTAMVTGIGALAATALDAVPAVGNLASALASTSGAALALPGLMTAGALGVTALVLALKDAGTQLAGLKPQFTALQDTVSARFWDKAKAPIEDLVSSVLPGLKAGLADTSGALGDMAAKLSATLKGALASEQIAPMFDRLKASIGAATPGVQSFATAMVTLGGEGSKFLEPLADGFSDLMGRFDQWVQTNAANGNIMAWTKLGITQLKELGRVAQNAGGIITGLFKAAGSGGFDGLKNLADALGRIRDIVNGSKFQTALGTIFSGAQKGAEGLGKALGPIGDMLATLAPAIGHVLSTAGQTVGRFVGKIADALNNPAVAKGITALVDGLSKGLQGLEPALEPLATMLGKVGEFAGQLAAQLGPVLGEALSALAPVVTDLLDAIEPLIPVLGQAFIDIIKAAAPLIQDLVPVVQSLVEQLVPVVQALAPAIADIFDALSPLIEQLGPLVTTLGPVLLQLVQAIAPIIQALAPVIAALAPVITILAEQLATTLAPVLEGLVPVIEAIAPAIQILADILVGVLGAAVKLLSGDWSGAWESIKTAFMDVWNVLVANVNPLVTVVIDAISNAVTWIKGVWQTAWSAISGFFSTAWATIKSVAAASVQWVATTISTIIGGIKATWTKVWNGIKSVASTVWNGIKSLIGGAINGVKSVISGALGTIKGLWSAAWSTIKSTLSTAWSRIVSAVSTGVSKVGGFFSSLPGKIVGFLSGLPGQMSRVGSQIIQGLIGGIKAMASRAIGAVSDVVGGAINGAKRLLGIHSPSKVFAQIGRYLGMGFGEGISGSVKYAQDATAELVGVTTDAFEDRNRLAAAANRALARTASASVPIATVPLTEDAQTPATIIVQGPLVQTGDLTVDSDDRVKQISQDLYTRATRQGRAQGVHNLQGAVR